MRSPNVLSRRTWLCALAWTAATVGGVGAQTYTWTAGASGNWSDPANWTAGPPVPPPPVGGGAGVGLAFAPTAGPLTATNDLAGTFTLNSLTFAHRYGFGALPFPSAPTVAGNPLAFAGAGAGVFHESSARAVLAAPSQLAVATTVGGSGSGYLYVTGALSGTGPLTINRTGAGQVVLSGGNTHSGGTVLAAGNLSLNNGSALGTGPLTVQGGTLRFNSFVGPSGIVVANNATLHSTLVLRGNNSGVFTGVLSGVGGVHNAGDAGINLRLTGANTYSGSTVAGLTPTGSGNTVILEGAAGSAVVSSGFLVAGRFANLTVDNRTTLASGQPGGNNTNRIGDAAALTLRSRGVFQYFANETAASSESLGALNASGSPFVTLNQSVTATDRSAAVTFSAYNPTATSAVLFRGINLGGAAPGTPGNDNVLFGNGAAVAAGMLGGGGGAGTTTISVLTTAFSHFNNGTSSTTWFGGGNSLATYDAVVGVRPLNTATEYAATLVSGASSADNVRLIAPTTGIDAATTVNALVLDRTNATTYGQVAGTGTLTVSSGLVLAAGTSGNADPVSMSRNRIDVGLDFGLRTGVIIAPEVITISGDITGTAGLHKAAGNELTLTGNNSGLTGAITITGGTLRVAQFSSLGGTGDVAIDGGTLRLTASDTLSAGRGVVLGDAWGTLSADADATFTVAGATSGAGSLIKSGSGTVVLAGAVNHTGSTVITGGVLETGAAGLGASSSLVIAPGGTLRTAAATTFAGPVLLTAGSGTGTIDTAADLTLTGGIGDNGVPTNVLGLNKTGAATLALGGTSTFSGALTVNAGTVRVTGTLGQINTTGNGVTVASGATLGGTGTIVRDVQLSAGAVLDPGAADGLAGALTVEGNLSAAGAVFDWDLGGAGAGQYDVLVLGAGAAAYISGATLNLSLVGGYVPGGGDSLRIIDVLGDGAGVAGVFANDSGGFVTSGGWIWQISYAGGDGNDVVLFNAVPVPEAGAAALTAVALLAGGLAALRRRTPHGGN
jgi:autotransporter-associated beta strand protein